MDWNSIWYWLHYTYNSSGKKLLSVLYSSTILEEDAPTYLIGMINYKYSYEFEVFNCNTDILSYSLSFACVKVFWLSWQRGVEINRSIFSLYTGNWKMWLCLGPFDSCPSWYEYRGSICAQETAPDGRY